MILWHLYISWHARLSMDAQHSGNKWFAWITFVHSDKARHCEGVFFTLSACFSEAQLDADKGKAAHPSHVCGQVEE